MGQVVVLRTEKMAVFLAAKEMIDALDTAESAVEIEEILSRYPAELATFGRDLLASI